MSKQNFETIKTTTITKEYDEKGNLVKEVIEEVSKSEKTE